MLLNIFTHLYNSDSSTLGCLCRLLLLAILPLLNPDQGLPPSRHRACPRSRTQGQREWFDAVLYGRGLAGPRWPKTRVRENIDDGEGSEGDGYGGMYNARNVVARAGKAAEGSVSSFNRVI